MNSLGKKLPSWVIPTILFFVALALYIPSLRNGFVSDDNDIIRDVSSWGWGSFYTGTVFHLTNILWLSIYKLVGIVPWAFRLPNLLFYGGCAVLLYSIIKKICNERVAFISTIIWVVHPLLVESVAWIAGGVYTHYTFFFLLSFFLYLKNAQAQFTNRGLMYGSWGTYFISLLFNEKALVLCLLFLVYEWSRGTLKKNWRKLIPYFVVSGCFILFYIFQIQFRVSGVLEDASEASPFYNPLLQIPIAISSYFELLVFPRTLTLYHARLAYPPIEYTLRLIVVFVYLLSAVYVAWKHRRHFFWYALFLVPLLPVLTPLKVSWVYSERYAYLSSMGMIVLVVMVFDTVLYTVKQRRIRNVCSIVGILFVVGIVLLLTMRSEYRIRDWESVDTMWLSDEKVAPESVNVHNNLGDYWVRHGDLVKAEKEFRIALALSPDYSPAYHNLALVKEDQGAVSEAIALYQEAVAHNPNLWQSYQNMAALLFKQGDFNGALMMMKKALLVVPNSPDLQKNVRVIEEAMRKGR